MLPLFGGSYTVAAEKRHNIGHAQLHAVADGIFQLAQLGVPGKQRYFNTGLCGAGVALGHGKLHPAWLDGGNGAHILHSVGVTQNHVLTNFGAHNVSQVVGVGAVQGGAAIANFGGKIAVRHSVYTSAAFCRSRKPSRAFL